MPPAKSRLGKKNKRLIGTSVQSGLFPQPLKPYPSTGDQPQFSVTRRSLIACILQVIFDIFLPNMPGKPRSKHRSGCPVSISLEVLGDRWSLLVVRDLMVRGSRTFKEFQESGEGIASNILADRLQKLQAAGVITAEVEATDGRRVNYRLTEKGIDLTPVVLELLIWGARYEETDTPCAFIERMARNRKKIVAEVRRRWHRRDATPLQAKSGKWLWP